MQQGVHRGKELAPRIGFQEVAAHAGGERFAHELLGLVHREHQHAAARAMSHDAPRRLEPVELRHAQVEDDHVRREFLGQLHGGAPVGRLGANLPVCAHFQQRPEAAPHNVMIIRKEDARLGFSFHRFGMRARTIEPPG